jgi:hypothetical protein
MRKFLILTIVLSALLVGTPQVVVAGTTFTVSPGDDIQAVIDDASSGDTIVFALGTYSLSSTLNVNKSLTLTSADPYAATKPILDGGGTLGRIILIEADNVTIDGLEVANGTEDLIRQSGAYAGTAVRNSVIHDSSGDEGIQLKACTDCVVECNLVYDIAQDGISIAEGSYNSVIRNNEIHNVGSENAAIYVYDSYDMTVACNYIHDTPAANGIKMYKNYGGTHTIANNLIVGNAWQGGKRCYDEADGSTINIYKPRVDSTYVVAHNTLADNTGVDACGSATDHAIYVNDNDGSGFTTDVDDNIATNHTGYGIRVFYGAAVNYSYNDLWQNALGATDGNPVDGGDNISADPLYNPDYTLGAGSPCIGAASDGNDMGRLFDECGCAPPNMPPDCSNAAPSIDTIWPPNHKFVAVNVLGVTDPDGDPVSITIDSIYQDEPVDTLGDGSFTPDGQGVGTDTAEVRAERAGTKKVPGNGRVYHIRFTANDGNGGSCTGEVLVGVPHDVKDIPVDDGALYDSTALAP